MCQDLYQNTKESSKAGPTSRNCKIQVMQQQSSDGGHRIRAPRHGITCCRQYNTIQLQLPYNVFYSIPCNVCTTAGNYVLQASMGCRSSWQGSCTRCTTRGMHTDSSASSGDACWNLGWNLHQRMSLWAHSWHLSVILCCPIKSKVASGISFILMSSYWQLR